MGTFIGHIIPGTMFMMLGLWWIYSTWLRYFICRRQKRSFYVTLSFPFHCCYSSLSWLPIESILILIGVSYGGMTEITGGYYTVHDSTTQESSIKFYPESLQHIVMHLMFFLIGVISILNHYVSSLPEHMDIIAGILAFSSQGFLYYFHDHSGDPSEVQVHLYLAICMGTVAICSIFEIVQDKKKVYATLMRSYFTFLTGGWYYYIAFLLYGSSSDEYSQIKNPHSHGISMLIAFYFVLNMALVLILLFAVAFFAYHMSLRFVETIHDMKYRKSAKMVDNRDELEQLNINDSTGLNS